MADDEHEIPNVQVRLDEVFRRLDAALAASTWEEAHQRLCQILDQVEDERTGIPNEPDKWMDSERMYPPQSDRMSSVAGTDVKRFDSERHLTYIAPNGAMLICRRWRATEITFAKNGKDG
ncbi:MAG TPA: hypothetical protein VGX76_22770 [Pirellulales bacterium]|nr:hypothetical protein [Pirellulales bacterium]